MKTSEFIKRVEELGYDTESNKLSVRVYHGYILLASVYEESVNAVTTNIGESVPNDLFDLCVEYAKTPTEERESEKKYYLKLPFEVGNDGFYLNYNNNYGTYSFLSKFESSDWKTQFTQREIDALPSQDFIKTLIKEEEE